MNVPKVSNYQFNHLQQNLHIPFQTRFNNALKEQLTQRCFDISNLIHESIATNIKDIQMNFVPLIESIFGFGMEWSFGDWGLKLISRNLNPREFDSIHAFLEPNGVLFQLMRQLMTDPMNKYEFPKSLLPIPTKLSLDDGIIPNLYVNKIINPIASNTISLNAFEFYLFHFTYYIINNNQMALNRQNPYYLEQLNNANANPSNVIYYELVIAYLKSFVPLSDVNHTSLPQQSSQSSLWHSLSSTTSNLLHLGNASVNTPQVSSLNTPTLFKTSLFNTKPFNKTQVSDNSQNVWHRSRDPLGPDVWKCETIILIMTEIWLNHNVPHSLSKKQSDLSPSHRHVFTPNSDHMRAVRILVKHMHHFANSLSKDESIAHIELSPFDEVKRNIWTQKYPIQKKFYTFLRLSFERWPNDASLRIPLETWLSYIQPWRYVNATNEKQMFFEMEDRDSAVSGSYSPDQLINFDDWKKFISDNLLFYTVIFRQLIPRFLTLLDISSAKNALMLFRIAKVYHQSNLINLIKDIEVNLIQSETLSSASSWASSSTRGTLLSPSMRLQSNVNSLSLRNPLLESESASFEYVPLFSNATKTLIYDLLIIIEKSRNSMTEMIMDDSSRPNQTPVPGFGIINFFKSLFQTDDNGYLSEEMKRNINEKRKTEEQLKMCANRFATIFDLPQNIYSNQTLTSITNESIESPQSYNLIKRRNPINSNQNTPINSGNLYFTDNGTSKLTPLGRRRILTRLYSPEINTYEGNPDAQPVRSYEFQLLLGPLILLSTIINQKYGQKINDVYNSNTFIGLFSRNFISPPATYVKVVKSGTARPPERVTEHLPPRINLRFLANKSIVFYTIILLLIGYILGFNMIFFIFLCFAMILTYIFTKTLLTYVSGNVNN